MTEEQKTQMPLTCVNGTTVCTQVGPRLWLTDGPVGAVRNGWCSLSDGANRPLARVQTTQGMSAPSLPCASTHTHALVTVIYTAIKKSPVICVRMCCSTQSCLITEGHVKYMVMSREQTAGLSHTMKFDNRSIERVEEFKYLGTTLTNQILFRKKLRADWS